MKVVEGVFAVAVLAVVRPSAGQVEFHSAREAQGAFATNSSESVRSAAYGYALALVETERDGSSATLALSAIRVMSTACGRQEDYERSCRTLLASSNATTRAAAMSGLCDSLRRLGFSDAERAISALARDHAGDPMVASAALGKLMDLYGSAKLGAKALDTAALVLGVGPECLPAAHLSASYVTAAAHAADGDFAAAERVLVAAVGYAPSVPTGIGRRIAEMRLPEEPALRVARAVREKAAAVPIENTQAFRPMAEAASLECADLMRGLGRYDEAIGECRTVALFGSSTAYQRAVVSAAETLKAMDGNLGRAKALVDFNRSGEAPSAANPLVAFARLEDATRRGEIERLDEYCASAPWTGLLAAATRYLWADDAEKAVAAAARAFAEAPMSQKELQMCADAAAAPLLALTRDPAAARAVVDYLVFGANGPDGVAGTGDDVTDPVSMVRAYCTRCGKVSD